jgi:hypothetical protein
MKGTIKHHRMCSNAAKQPRRLIHATTLQIQTLLPTVFFLAMHMHVYWSTCSTIGVDYVLLSNVTIQPTYGAFRATSFQAHFRFFAGDPCRLTWPVDVDVRNGLQRVQTLIIQVP